MLALVTGGTGFVGRRVVDRLVARGDQVTVVSRDPARARRPGISARGWLPELDGYDAVVHLQGEPIFGRRWNEEVRAEIRRSRVDATRELVDTLGNVRADRRPKVLVCASAVGYYGDRGDEMLTETSGPGRDFMADVCVGWEHEAARAATLGVRVVSLRTGVVLGLGGGALAQMLLPFKLGVGGPIGSGKQYFSWIHLDDLAAMIVWAATNDDVRGPINAVAPGIVTNKAFSRALGRALHRPALLPVPPFALRIVFGEVAEVLTASQRCVPEQAQRLGFTYVHPLIDEALQDVVGR